MRVMAIESSAITASVAIVTDNVMTAEYTINYKKTHSQTLLPMIDEICKMTETDPETIDLIAVSVGPGSFTGLRIGAATGKGIALALDKEMVAVPTLQAMAYNFYGTDKLICPIMDAKRRHLYAALYEYNADGKLEPVMDQELVSYEELADKLNEINKEVIFAGDGVDVSKDAFEELLKCKHSYAPAHMSTQRAASVALAGVDIYNREGATDAAMLKPDYLRPSQAERERMERQ